MGANFMSTVLVIGNYLAWKSRINQSLFQSAAIQANCSGRVVDKPCAIIYPEMVTNEKEKNE